MRLFESYVVFFILSLPFVYWYVKKSAKFSDFFTIQTSVAFILIGYMISIIVLYVWLPTYREHMEPAVTMISLMVADGYPAYTTFNDPNIYSLLYGPTTYLFQSQFLKLFDNPILGSKLYGVLSFSSGYLILSVLLVRKYGFRIALQGMFYMSAIVLLFLVVAFRNQSDSIILFGVSLAASSVLLPSNWKSKLMLIFGVAVAVSAKFHAIGYVLPLFYILYRQHGLRQLLIIGIAAIGLALSPFLLKPYDLANFLTIMEAYSRLPLHIWLFGHNISMAYIVFLPLLLLIYFDFRKKAAKPLLKNESLWTLIMTNIMIILVCLTAGIDGAGSYHLVPFAPATAVLYTKYYSRNRDDFQSAYKGWNVPGKTFFMVIMVAWVLSILNYTISMQKSLIRFMEENSSYALHDELVMIGNEIKINHWRALMGYSSSEGYKNTYYRPLLWSVLKDNSMDPIALMGRRMVGVEIPDAGLRKIQERYYDVVIIPKPGKPFSMYSAHDTTQMVFGKDLLEIFQKNYSIFKEYQYFDLWRPSDNK